MLGSTSISRAAHAVTTLAAHGAGLGELRVPSSSLEQATVTAQRSIATVTAQRSIATGLIAREPRTLAPADWSSLHELLMSDPDGMILKGPRTIAGIAPARDRVVRFMSGSERYDGTLDRYFAAWRTAELPLDEQRRLASELLDRNPDTFERSDWAALDALLQADQVGHVIRGIRNLGVIGSADAWMTGLVSGKYKSNSVMQRYFSSWKFTGTPPDEMRALATQIVAKDPMTLTTDEWRTLMNIVEADPHGTIVAAPRELPGQWPITDGLYGLARGGTENDSHIFPYIAAWRRALDPAYPSKLAAADTALRTGMPTAQQLDLLVVEGIDVLALARQRLPELQAAIAMRMVKLTQAGIREDALGPLMLARESLVARTGLTGEALALRDETIAMIDSNIARINGHTRLSDIRGFSNHPDYAQIGAIQGNVDTLDMLGHRNATPAAPAATVMPAATEPTDVLIW